MICADKTGTLTQEGMSVKQIYDGRNKLLVSLPGPVSDTAMDVLASARWASETEPFDAMERAIVTAFVAADPVRAEQAAPMVYEYPLAATPPMMTHVWQIEGHLVVAGKGAVEHVLKVCHLDVEATDTDSG